MLVGLRRTRSLGWISSALASTLWVGCSRTLPHEFDPKTAGDYAAPHIEMPFDDEQLEQLAVLLVPSNTTVFRPSRPSTPWFSDNRRIERYVGPARVFLRPGKADYLIGVQTPDGVIDLGLDAELEAGKCYQLRIVEDGDGVAFELFGLHASSYSALYPKGIDTYARE